MVHLRGGERHRRVRSVDLKPDTRRNRTFSNPHSHSSMAKLCVQTLMVDALDSGSCLHSDTSPGCHITDYNSWLVAEDLQRQTKPINVTARQDTRARGLYEVRDSTTRNVKPNSGVSSMLCNWTIARSEAQAVHCE